MGHLFDTNALLQLPTGTLATRPSCPTRSTSWASSLLPNKSSLYRHRAHGRKPASSVFLQRSDLPSLPTPYEPREVSYASGFEVKSVSSSHMRPFELKCSVIPSFTSATPGSSTRPWNHLWSPTISARATKIAPNSYKGCFPTPWDTPTIQISFCHYVLFGSNVSYQLNRQDHQEIYPTISSVHMDTSYHSRSDLGRFQTLPTPKFPGIW